MRSASLPLVLIFALLLAVPGLAAGDTLSDAAFLRSLAEMPLDLPPVGIPAPDPRACNISRPCGDGNNAACMGNASCVYSQRGVKCDGVGRPVPTTAKWVGTVRSAARRSRWFAGASAATVGSRTLGATARNKAAPAWIEGDKLAR